MAAQQRNADGLPITKSGEIDQRVNNGVEPTFVYDEEIAAFVREQRESGAIARDIADHLEMSMSTLYDLYGADIRKSRGKCRMDLAKKLFERSETSDSVLIFLGRTQLGWTEKVDHNHQGLVELKPHTPDRLDKKSWEGSASNRQEAMDKALKLIK